MGKSYSKQFKQEALALCEVEGMTVAAVARDLGISDGVLYRWRQEAVRDGTDAFRGKGKRTAEQARLAALERQVKVLEMERDILKKALGIFAEGRR
jgi:transposase-like protein